MSAKVEIVETGVERRSSTVARNREPFVGTSSMLADVEPFRTPTWARNGRSPVSSDSIRTRVPGRHGDSQETVTAPFSDASASTRDRKSTRLNSSHVAISYAVFCLKKKIVFYSIIFLDFIS